jgi:hypothetical protein
MGQVILDRKCGTGQNALNRGHRIMTENRSRIDRYSLRNEWTMVPTMRGQE